MIPKIIHYCWFGRTPLPELAQKCIASWRKFLPDYEIKEWNEDNFDINAIHYTREAYRMKKYAYVSDYARFYILYHHGGLYFDTDVEIIKPMNDIIAKGSFMGKEFIKLSWHDIASTGINPGLGLGAAQGLSIYKEILSFYAIHHFVSWTGHHNSNETVVEIVTRIIEKHKIRPIGDGVELCHDIYIYSPEYFSPKNYTTGVLSLTSNTISIHHYAASWVEKETVWQKVKRRLKGIRVRLKS